MAMVLIGLGILVGVVLGFLGPRALLRKLESEGKQDDEDP